VGFRLLVFLGLAYFFFRLLKLFIFKGKRQRNPLGHDREAEEMVLDPQCQTYLPKGESILRSGYYFCSEECARLYLSS